MSQHLKPVHVNGQTAHLQPAHRAAGQAIPTPLVTVSATVELTVDEVAAVLHDWIAGGGDLTELYDDTQVRQLVAESVVNGGCQRVDEVSAVASQRGGELLDECGRRAQMVFSS